MDITNPIYSDPEKAREHLESIRWPDGPVCPHCGVVGEATKLKGKSTRPGVWKCKACQKPFSVTVGTVFERSKVPLNKWVLATHLLCSSKKGMSAHQLHRTLGVTYKTAWFMAHRIREAMKDENPGPLGGEGQIVEADETYFGQRDRRRKSPQRGDRPYKRKKSIADKRTVVSLVERGGRVRSFHVDVATVKSVRELLFTSVSRDSILFTDESRLYVTPGKEFAKHESVKHSAKEYARGDVHTNTIEGYFSIFKRGMRGVYQHCGETHVSRYLTEFDFRYNTRQITDVERTDEALKGIEGKRLTYRRTNEASLA